MNEDVVTNETIDKDYAIEEVRMACKHFGDLYFYFSKVLFEEFAEKINTVIINTRNFDNYYIRAVKPFFINQNTYFKVLA